MQPPPPQQRSGRLPPSPSAPSLLSPPPSLLPPPAAPQGPTHPPTHLRGEHEAKGEADGRDQHAHRQQPAIHQVPAQRIQRQQAEVRGAAVHACAGMGVGVGGQAWVAGGGRPRRTRARHTKQAVLPPRFGSLWPGAAAPAVPRTPPQPPLTLQHGLGSCKADAAGVGGRHLAPKALRLQRLPRKDADRAHVGDGGGGHLGGGVLGVWMRIGGEQSVRQRSWAARWARRCRRRCSATHLGQALLRRRRRRLQPARLAAVQEGGADRGNNDARQHRAQPPAARVGGRRGRGRLVSRHASEPGLLLLHTSRGRALPGRLLPARAGRT